MFGRANWFHDWGSLVWVLDSLRVIRQRSLVNNLSHAVLLTVTDALNATCSCLMGFNIPLYSLDTRNLMAWQSKKTNNRRPGFGLSLRKNVPTRLPHPGQPKLLTSSVFRIPVNRLRERESREDKNERDQAPGVKY